MKNDSDGTGKGDKKINRIRDQLAKLRAKLNVSERSTTTTSFKEQT